LLKEGSPGIDFQYLPVMVDGLLQIVSAAALRVARKAVAQHDMQLRPQLGLLFAVNAIQRLAAEFYSAGHILQAKREGTFAVTLGLSCKAR
jgi:hypothetical protein